LKAVRMHGYGGAEQLYYLSCEAPKITEPNEVIVKLKAASLNHIDIWNRLGATGINVAMPHILGADGTGVIAETRAIEQLVGVLSAHQFSQCQGFKPIIDSVFPLSEAVNAQR
jgi:NADPH:quinone reductase-like Zn-dependent oxidoreductase